MPVKFHRLSEEAINGSTGIQSWLNQFSKHQQTVAKSLLKDLRFVKENVFRQWFIKGINSLASRSQKGSSAKPLAFYAVAKLPVKPTAEQRKSVKGQPIQSLPWKRLGAPSLWTFSGNILPRPSHSLGSEDMICSLLRGTCRTQPNYFFDHPSIATLKQHDIHDIVLLDDSINSGEKVSKYLQGFFNHKSILSWYSRGWITIHVVSLIRTKEAERIIRSAMPGSIRSRKSRSQLRFCSQECYDQTALEKRWSYPSLIEGFCRNHTAIPVNRRMGYGDVMANFVFMHSVPNNLPGCLWFEPPSINYLPLFTGRMIPSWLPELLEIENPNPRRTRPSIQLAQLDHSTLQILDAVRKGIRKPSSLARQMQMSEEYIEEKIVELQDFGLIESDRITRVGSELLNNSKEKLELKCNWELVVPHTWCADP